MGEEQNLAAAMRAGMRRLASGVSVITTRTATQERQAMTASSITSLSDSPASLLVCVNNQTTMSSVLTAGQLFAVNILSCDQSDISNACASGEQGEHRFDTGQWYDDQNGVPILKGCQVAFSCIVDQVHVYGTHNVVIGKIQQVSLESDSVNALVYVDGGYQ